MSDETLSILDRTARRIAHNLFTNGSGDHAKRLVMELSGDRGGGGWCEGAVVDQIRKALHTFESDLNLAGQREAYEKGIAHESVRCRLVSELAVASTEREKQYIREQLRQHDEEVESEFRTSGIVVASAVFVRDEAGAFTQDDEHISWSHWSDTVGEIEDHMKMGVEYSVCVVLKE